VTKVHRSVWLLWLVAALAGSARAQQPQDLGALEPQKPREFEMGPGQKHRFHVTARSGDFFHVSLEKKGIDIVLSILDPEGLEILSSNSPNVGFGFDHASIVADRAGEYTVLLEDKGEFRLEGRYRIELVALRAPTEEDRARLHAESVFRAAVEDAAVEDAAAKNVAADRARAVEGYTEAAMLFERLNDRYMVALSVHTLSIVDDDDHKALDFCNRALPLERALGDRAAEGATLEIMGTIYADLGQDQEALKFFQQALPVLRAAGHHAAEAHTLTRTGNVYFDLGDMPKALELYNQALPLLRSLGDHVYEASTLGKIARAYYRSGDNQKALETSNLALPIIHAARNRGAEASILNLTADLYADMGEKQKAVDFHNRAMDIYRALGNRSGQALTLNNTAVVYDDLGEKQKALDLYNQALALHRAEGDRANEAVTLGNVANLYVGLGDLQKALEYYQQALTIHRAIGDRHKEAVALNNLGNIYYGMGDMAKALAAYNQALPLRRAVADRLGEAVTLSQVASAYSKMANRPQALAFYNQALTIYTGIHDRSGEAATLNRMAVVYYDLGDRQKALESYDRARTIYHETGARANEARAMNDIGVVYYAEGDKEEALEYYNRAVLIDREVRDRAGEAATLANIAQVYLDLGEKQAALDDYKLALVLDRAVSDHAGEIACLRALGSLYAARGEREKALEFLAQTIPNAAARVRVLAIGIRGAAGGQATRQAGDVAAAFAKLGAETTVLTGDDATLGKIEAAISRIGQASGPSDAAVVFFSGQGDASPDGEYRLHPAPDPKQPGEEAAISSATVRSWIDRFPGRHVILCFDTGDAGGAFDRFARSISAAASPGTSPETRNIVLIGPAESSPGDGASRGGVLTEAFVKTLAIETDMNHDGWLSTAEIEAALYTNMIQVQEAAARPGTPITIRLRPRVYSIGSEVLLFAAGPQALPESRGATALRQGPAESVNDEFSGRFYGVLIATGDYQEWPKLTNPTYDAEAIKTELSERYGFAAELLKNPSKTEFTNKLADLKRRQFGPDDELLVFIAGHGTYDEVEKTGYLIAKDSLRDDAAHNSQISQQWIFNTLSGITARHVLIVIDACFSGAIAGLKRGDANADITYPDDLRLKLEAWRRKRRDRTLIFLTSGGKEYVPDGQPGAHSPFAYQFLRALKSKNPGSDGILTFRDFQIYADQVQDAPQPKYGAFAESEPASDFWLFTDPALRGAPARRNESLDTARLAGLRN